MRRMLILIAVSAVAVFGATASGTTFAQDVDGDGVPDAEDNCPNDYNPGQEDSDVGSFWYQMVISDAAEGAFSVFSADLDGDGDNDVLSASLTDDKIAWYENLDGLGSFGPQIVISTAADGARSVFAADIDGDEDNDVLSASGFDDKIAWYQNLDGAGSFGSQIVISTDGDGAVCVFAADLDRDDDIDVLSASLADGKIAWYENDGQLSPTFTAHIISTDAGGANSVHAADLDNDGDLEIISGSHDDDKIAWYENLTIRESPTAAPLWELYGAPFDRSEPIITYRQP